MAFLYLIRGDFTQAEQHLKFALSTDPLNPQTLFYKAYFLYRKEQYTEAITLIDQLLEPNLQNVPMLVIRFYAWLMAGQTDRASKALNDLPEGWIMPDEILGLRCLIEILDNPEAKPSQN